MPLASESVMLTVEQVKQELPSVHIFWEGKLYWGRVTGRANKFASVSPYQLIDDKPLVTTIMGPVFQYTWISVARAANGGMLRA